MENPLREKIQKVLDGFDYPISIRKVHQLIPEERTYDINCEVWDMGAYGLIRLVEDWKIIKSNDGGYF
jgi:hypothetical protein